MAGRPGTSVAYIVLAQDIVKDIADQLGIQTVRLACEAELEVAEAVDEIKRAIPVDEPSTSYQGVSGGTFTKPVEVAILTEDPSIGGITSQDPLGELIQPSFLNLRGAYRLFKRKQPVFGAQR